VQPPLRAVGAQLTEEELKALRKEDKARMKAELAARLAGLEAAKSKVEAKEVKFAMKLTSPPPIGLEQLLSYTKLWYRMCQLPRASMWKSASSPPPVRAVRTSAHGPSTPGAASSSPASPARAVPGVSSTGSCPAARLAGPSDAKDSPSGSEGTPKPPAAYSSACESGAPVHRGADYFANNVMIAALTAPRPQLLVSDGKDWTANTPRVEFPFLQKIYGYYGAADKVTNVHLPDEGHDYGPSKRAAVYRFFAAQLDLNLAAVTNAAGQIDESRITLDRAATLRVFTADFPVPPHALHDAAAISRAFTALQKP
jgi:hypothetical protein